MKTPNIHISFNKIQNINYKNPVRYINKISFQGQDSFEKKNEELSFYDDEVKKLFTLTGLKSIHISKKDALHFLNSGLNQGELRKAIAICEKGIDASNCITLLFSGLNEKNLQKAIELCRKGISGQDAKEIIKEELNKKQTEIVTHSLKEKLISGSFIIRIVKKLNDSQIKILDDIIESKEQITSSLYGMSYVTDEEVRSYKKYKKEKFSPINALFLSKAKYDEKDLAFAKKLLARGIKKEEVDTLIKANLDDEQISTILKMKDSGVRISYAIQLISSHLNEKQLNKAIELCKKGLDANSAISLVLAIISEAEYQKVTSLYINHGLDVYSAIELVKTEIEESALEKASTICSGSKFIAVSEAAKIADDENKYNHFVEYTKSGLSKYNALELAKTNFTEEEFKKSIELAKKGYEVSKIIYLAKANLNEEQIIRACNLSSYLNINKAIEIAQTHFESNEEEKKAIGLCERGLSVQNALSVARSNFDSKTNNKIISLCLLGVSFNDAIELTNNQNKLQRFQSLQGILSVKNIMTLVNSDEKYNRYIDLSKKGISRYEVMDLVNFDINKPDEVAEKNFHEKTKILATIQKLKNTLKKMNINFEKEYPNYVLLESEINRTLDNIIQTTKTSKDDVKIMAQGFFRNNGSIEEEIAKFDFAKYGKKGLPLKYPRKEFVFDIANELKNLDVNKQEEITRKLGIELVKNTDGEIIGYNGIIDLTKLSANGVQGKILSYAKKFIEENKIETNNTEVDKALNSLITGMREFINVIGKEQHSTHDYSLDIHILSVLKNAISDPRYKNLTNLDKTVLKYAVILHDISKKEGISDKEHPNYSALFANDILEKYHFPKEIQDRIFDLIKNHHFLEDFNLGKIDSSYVASLFRRENDFEIAKIIAEADLKSVNKMFYASFSNAFDKLGNVDGYLDRINRTGQLIFTTRLLDKNKIPEIKFKNHTYRVINFRDLPYETDLKNFGFAPNTLVKDARFLVHTVDDISNLDTMGLLTKASNGGCVCSSFISKDSCATYRKNNIGVILNAQNINIANAARENQGSGDKKNYKNFSNILTGVASDENFTINHRILIPNKIQKELNLTKEEYRELYKQIAPLKHLSQIKDNDIYIISNKKFTGAQIKKAIKEAQDATLNSFANNEIIVLSPQIEAFFVKGNTLNELSSKCLEYIRKNNLPIYMF